jgi:hypothetical protein
MKVQVFWWFVVWLTLIWFTCKLHKHVNALAFVLPFCFVMCSCLSPFLLQVLCFCDGCQMLLNFTCLLYLSTLSLLLLPCTRALLVILDDCVWAEAPVVWSEVYIVGCFGWKDLVLELFQLWYSTDWSQGILCGRFKVNCLVLPNCHKPQMSLYSLHSMCVYLVC